MAYSKGLYWSFHKQLLEVLYKNTFSTEHLKTIASEFLQKDIHKFKEYHTNESTKKNHLWGKKGNREQKETKSNVSYIIEGLAATDKD